MLLKKTLLVSLLFALSTISLSVYANEIESNAISELRQISQDDARRVNELTEHQYQLKPWQAKQDNSDSDESTPTSESCLPIAGVYLQGVTLLSKSDLNTLTALPEKCISDVAVNRLTKEITALYLEKGYITSRVQFIPLNEQNELGLQIIEGFVEDIKGGDRWVNAVFLFPNLKGNPLKLQDIDQALDQANRLQSNLATVDILPGKTVGGSILQLRNQHNKPWSIYTSLDNYGQKSTGRWQARISADIDSPLGISDYLNLSVKSTTGYLSARYSRGYSAFYSVPYGALTLSVFTNYSHFINPLTLARNTKVKLNGRTIQDGLRADYVFRRNNRQITSLNAQFTYKDNRTFFNGSRLDASSAMLSIVELGINHLQVFPKGVLRANISIEKGLPWFTKNIKVAGNGTHFEFTKGKLSLSWNQQFLITDEVYRFNSIFYGQYSNHLLPGIEWISTTDKSAVRGFTRNNLSADNGWYVRNTLSRNFNLFNIQLMPKVGIDIGRVIANTKDADWRSNLGFSLGLSATYGNALFDIEVNRGHMLSHSPTKEPTQVLSRFSYSF